MHTIATNLVKTIQQNGYTAYFAGGAVRDILLGQEPVDIDIATSAKPEEIEALFAKTFAIGKHFGVILVQEAEHHFEIATFRSDGGYSDGRRPDAIYFTDAKEDALRRDFTINGMFFDPVTNTLHDFVDGQKDLEAGILRFIGNAHERLQEDHLRILRAVRFKNRFGLTYDQQATEALQEHASLIVAVAGERIREELTKMIVHSKRRQAFADLKQFGILEHIIPDLSILKTIPQPENHHSEGDVFAHSLLTIDQLPENPNPELAWAALLHDIGKGTTLSYQDTRIRFPHHAEEGEKIAARIMKQLRFSKFSTAKIRWLIRHHHLFDEYDDMKHVTKLHYFDHPFFEDLIALHEADLFGCIPKTPEIHKAGEEHLAHIKEEYEDAHFQNLLPSAQEELLNGEEIMNLLNLKAGKQVGYVKEKLREAQLEGKIGDKNAAEEWLRENFL